MLFGVDGQVVAVTGSSGVIFSHVCQELAGLGAKVAMLYHENPKAVELARAIKENGGSALAVQCDVMEETSIRNALELIKSEFGRVDALINGAGGNRPSGTVCDGQTFCDLGMDGIEKVFDLNFAGTIMPTQAFLREFASQGHGIIINTCSMAGIRPLTNTPGYSCAKAAIATFTQWLAVQVRIDFPKANIRVNAIAPGFLDTEQNHRMLYEADGRTLTTRGRSILDHTPLGRFGEPKELLGPIVLLLSEAGRFLNGTIIPVDGGFAVYSGVGPLNTIGEIASREVPMPESESIGDGGPLVGSATTLQAGAPITHVDADLRDGSVV